MKMVSLDGLNVAGVFVLASGNWLDKPVSKQVTDFLFVQAGLST